MLPGMAADPDEVVTVFNDIIRDRFGRAHGDGLGNAPHGFPGPAGHNVAYTRLKERQAERLIREAKAKAAPGNRLAHIMLLTGTRRGESARRARTQKAAFRKSKSQVWVNPLIDWTNAQMRAYRVEHELPESDVSALMHMSGECGCGAFAAPGEREMRDQLFPEWGRWLAALEAEAEERGIPACRWGERPFEVPASAGEMCSDCQLRLAA